MKTFTERVLEIVKGIPRGRVLSYGEVARLAGSPGAARAVGTIMRQNLRPDVPCHRVIQSSGRVGHYNRGGEAEKITKLQKEGVEIRNKRVARHETHA